MKEVKPHSVRAWILAVRPKTLTAALIPVLLGTSLAIADECFAFVPALLCALFAGGMQIAANLINDLYDYKKGSDRSDRLGPKRACAQGWISPQSMRRGILLTIAISCLIGCGLLPYGGWKLIPIGVFCVFCAFLYTTTFSYRGGGDILVLIFFGFVPVAGTYYVQAHTLTVDVWVASLISGLAIDTLLMVNNYRDRFQDSASKKRTLVVRFGEPFGRYAYLCLGLGATLLSFWFARGWNLTGIVLPFCYLYAHLRTWVRLSELRCGEKLNSILDETSRNMLLLGILVSLSILIEIKVYL